MNTALSHGLYPAGLTGAALLFSALLSVGAPLTLASHLPIVLTGVAILLLEQRCFARADWKPHAADLRTDAAFMATVQVVWPSLLAAAVVFALADFRHDAGPDGPWPHEWPLPLQVLTMVLAVDLMRYWLHRACHHFPALWRLHEVHHSPDILYLLNVGRFHPLEKALHFSLDTAPFLLLGVAPEVLAGYALVYSVNGFFQHSNLALRYGWLNYVVGSAETHRWHHARDPKVAACNFGSTTAVWDVLFGTWYLPPGREVGELGIPDRHYPQGFLAQIAAPFRHVRHSPLQPVRRQLLHLGLRWIRWRAGRRLAQVTRDPMRAQDAVLARILRDNRDSAFGRRHGFAALEGYTAYASTVDVQDYETLRPYIEAEIARGEAALTLAPPAGYVCTSGTTGQPKHVPVTAAHLAELGQLQRTAVAFQHGVCPHAFDGTLLVIYSPIHEGLLANGKPFGSASGIVALNSPGLVRDRFVVPPEVMAIPDSRVKYLTILRLAVVRRDVSYLGTANPSTLLQLARLYRAHSGQLVSDVRQGGFFLSDALPENVRAALAGRLQADPARADVLAKLDACETPPKLADLWPELKLVVTWTCASAGVAADALRAELAPATRLFELGYMSSEFRGTITLGRNRGSGLPTLDTHFFEFVERQRWDTGQPAFLTIDGLQKGHEYYVIVTTPSGLYRYFINDVVRVTGFLHRTPLLRFVQKGKGVTSITGEKLYEAQVLDAVRQVMAQHGPPARFVMMLADETLSAYRLHVEPDPSLALDALAFGQAVDAQLCRLNIEYGAKRESGRLGALEAHWLAPGTGEAYKEDCVRRGQREGQFKVVALNYARDMRFDFRPHRRTD